MIGNPALGAALLMVTVPVEDVPPITEVGLRVTDETVGAVMAKLQVLEDPLRVAVITEVTFVATGTVVTVNVAVVAPAGTVTVAGGVAADWLLLKAMGRPAAGAALLIVTVPVEETPPTTVLGLIKTEESVGAVIVSVAD